MDFSAAVRQHSGKLTPSDLRLIEVLLNNPTEGAFLSAALLAERAEVHQAAATRLAQKLGYAGYPELRAQLQADLLALGEPAERMQKRLDQMSDDAILEKLVESEVAALQTLPRYVGSADLERAAAGVSGAEHVFIFGRGHASSLVDLVDRRLRRFGYRTTALQGDNRELAERALAMGAKDCVLAFAFHRPAAPLIQLLSHAAEVGARTIVVSDMTGATLRPAPDVLLAAPRGREEEFQTLSVPMAICNALVLTIAQRDKEPSLLSLSHLAELIEQFGGPNGKGESS